VGDVTKFIFYDKYITIVIFWYLISFLLSKSKLQTK